LDATLIDAGALDERPDATIIMAQSAIHSSFDSPLTSTARPSILSSSPHMTKEVTMMKVRKTRIKAGYQSGWSK